MENEQAQATDYSEGYICPTCHGAGWITEWQNIDGYGVIEIVKERCPECSRRYREIDSTGVPLIYAEADLSSFDFDAYGIDMSRFKEFIYSFFNNYLQWQTEGMGLYLCSKTPGSGKSLLACCVGRSIMLKYDIQMRFITAADYLSLVGESYHNEAGALDGSKVYRDCDLLVLDDLGVQKTGSWQDQEIFRLINQRISTGKICIITSNMPQKDLNLNDRTIDRVISCTLPLALPEISIRRKHAENKQAKMMNIILSAAPGGLSQNAI